MKFVLKCVSNSGARRGCLSGIERLPDLAMETPNLLIYTQSGTIPHLTPDVLQFISPTPQAVILPIPSLAALEERMKHTKQNIAEFIGLKHMATISAIMDPGKERLEGFHKMDVLSVQTRNGKKEYTANTYMDFIESLRPDFFIALCDGDTSVKASSKRVAKSMSRSKVMLSGCADRLTESTALSKPSLIVPLEGGVNAETRKAYSKDIEKSFCPKAVVIDGLGQYGEEVMAREVEDFEKALVATLEPCRTDTLRILLGPWHPRAVLALIELGIDTFDSTYPHLVTEKGCALLLTCTASEQLKKPKPIAIEFDLKDSENAQCLEPISTNCGCLTCKNHTRAYIHHLLNVKEMLASVLLSIHNLQQYMEFFSIIRQSIDNGTFQDLKNQFQ